MAPEDIKAKIETGLPGARVEILDPMNDGVHLKACVRYAGFAGKKLLEQHRMVMGLLKEELRGELHALALETEVETKLEPKAED